jgi:hypothetical protein
VTTTNGITATQRNYLERVRSASRTANWAGSSYSVLDALVRKGLITVERGRVAQWNTYRLTDASRAALSAGEAL